MHIYVAADLYFAAFSSAKIGIFGYLNSHCPCGSWSWIVSLVLDLGAASAGNHGISHQPFAQYERPAAWGTTGLPYQPALGVGLSKPWGVWEGASMSGLGGRRRAMTFQHGKLNKRGRGALVAKMHI
jgi:hypothetical protein